MAAIVTPNCGLQELQSALDRANTQVLVATSNSEKREIRAVKKRLQDRIYQRKHRAKREEKLRDLQTQVSKLHGNIARLYCELHQRKAEAKNAEVLHRQQQQHFVGSLHDRTVALVAQYFQVYQNGYSLAMAPQQETFLRSVLSVNVKGVDTHGIEAFVEQWRLYGQHFAEFVLEPQAWKVESCGDCVVMEVEVMLYMRFNRHTVGALFPSLKNGTVSPEVVQPLVTGITTVAGTFTFVVDRTGFVTSLLVNLQMLETLRRVMSSLPNVARFTRGSRIALESGTITVV